MFCVWIISAYHSKHCTGKYQDIREDQVDQELTGGAQSTNTYKRSGSPGRKQRRKLLTNMDGVGQCVQLDAGWIKVKVKVKMPLTSDTITEHHGNNSSIILSRHSGDITWVPHRQALRWKHITLVKHKKTWQFNHRDHYHQSATKAFPRL